MDMKLITSILILIAALGSAIWNLHVKQSKDSFVFVTLMVLPQLAIAIPLSILFPIQTVKPLYYLLLSSLVHTGYIFFLVHAYRNGMLSRVFPLGVGMATLISLAFWHLIFWQRLSIYEYLGIILVSMGVISFITVGKYGEETIDRRSVGFALVASLFIFSYTSIDTYGIRTESRPISYISWLFMIKGLMLTIPMILAMKIKWQTVVNTKNYIVAGLLAGFGYAMAVYAFLFSPTSVVLALRSVSILFVFLLSVLVLKEKTSRKMLYFTLAISAGVFLLLMPNSTLDTNKRVPSQLIQRPPTTSKLATPFQTSNGSLKITIELNIPTTGTNKVNGVIMLTG